MNQDQKKLLGIIGEQLARIIELEECLSNADATFEQVANQGAVMRVKR